MKFHFFSLKQFLICVGLLSISELAFSYDNLRVQDPQQPWRSATGNIDEAIISVRPRGIYMEYGLYLTFSSKGSYLNSVNDTLEVQFDFDLPKGSIVHDSWLWVGDSIVQAIIIDKWKASSIYEGIVKRRRDPSVLYKVSANSYQLRVFPMAGNSTRKVKITYLVPVEWSAKSTSAPLPVNLLKTSYNNVPDLNLINYHDSIWKSPGVKELTGLSYTPDTSLKYSTALINKSVIVNTGSLNTTYSSPMKNGTYLGCFTKGSENFYELAFVPSLAMGITAPKKTAILVDYDISKSDVKSSEVITNIKALLHSNFTSLDSFNLILSNFSILRISNNWLRADSMTIENAFASLPAKPVSDYSNFTSLIGNGIDFVKMHGNNGDILLITDVDQYGASVAANQLINDIKALMSPIFPIHIADFTIKNYTYNYIGSQYYYGSEYFYSNLCKITGGNYFRQFNSSYTFSDLLSISFQSLDSPISSFDLYSTLQSGFCYGRYNIKETASSFIYPSSTILQIGKYSGGFPFVLQASGFHKSTPFTKTIQIQQSDSHVEDSLTKKAWTGNYIRTMESGAVNNQIINDIISNSIENRVLSIYTAFLALEPNDSIKFCPNCVDETKLISTQNIDTGDSAIMVVAPNPFSFQTTLTVRIPEGVNSSEVSFRVYNSLAQVVKTFNINTFTSNRFQIDWDGVDDSGKIISSGIYFISLITPNQRQSLKLIKLE
ncbi:MAG: T9SS type A sorting domain-containing protein [Bacteroidetes bacterium]|nr:T9SS type A sorting domain-containing protein [Bacteroidota bacterium]